MGDSRRPTNASKDDVERLALFAVFEFRLAIFGEGTGGEIAAVTPAAERERRAVGKELAGSMVVRGAARSASTHGASGLAVRTTMHEDESNRSLVMEQKRRGRQCRIVLTPSMMRSGGLARSRSASSVRLERGARPSTSRRLRVWQRSLRTVNPAGSLHSRREA